MNTKDIIKEKYKVAKRFYEANKHTTECSYYMGYMDALGELLERIEQEEKKIPEKLFGEPRHIYNDNELYIVGKVNEIIDYLKSKGDE